MRMGEFSNLLLFIYSFICASIVWAISPLCPLPPPFSPILSLPGRTFSALFSNFVEEKT
jgi:hypothetical protein